MRPSRSAFLFVFVLTASLGSARAGDAPVEDMLAASVMVVAPGGTGSGVVVHNGEEAFVWTAGHVAAGTQKVEAVVDTRTGLPRVQVSYADVSVARPVFRGGRTVGEDFRYAEVIRFSDLRLGGEDLALLRLRDPAFGRKGVRFSRTGYVPAVGDAVWHVGSPNGRRGMESLYPGCVSATGRLLSRGRFVETEGAKVCDQMSVPALGGCSGGGVFLRSNGECIGLLMGGLDEVAESSNVIIPARRLRDFARRTGCLWAVDGSVPVPSGELGGEAVTDRPVPVPKEMK
jgi:hypothetical protein